jgi:hypothetical protein
MPKNALPQHKYHISAFGVRLNGVLHTTPGRSSLGVCSKTESSFIEYPMRDYSLFALLLGAMSVATDPVCLLSLERRSGKRDLRSPPWVELSFRRHYSYRMTFTAQTSTGSRSL